MYHASRACGLYVQKRMVKGWQVSRFLQTVSRYESCKKYRDTSMNRAENTTYSGAFISDPEYVCMVAPQF